MEKGHISVYHQFSTKTLIEFTHSKFSICSCVSGAVSMATGCIFDILIRTHTRANNGAIAAAVAAACRIWLNVCTSVVKRWFFSFPHTPHSRNSIRGEWMAISLRESSVQWMCVSSSMWESEIHVDVVQIVSREFPWQFHTYEMCLYARAILSKSSSSSSSSPSSSCTSSIVHTCVWHMRIHVSVCCVLRVRVRMWEHELANTIATTLC